MRLTDLAHDILEVRVGMKRLGLVNDDKVAIWLADNGWVQQPRARLAWAEAWPLHVGHDHTTCGTQRPVSIHSMHSAPSKVQRIDCPFSAKGK